MGFISINGIAVSLRAWHWEDENYFAWLVWPPSRNCFLIQKFSSKSLVHLWKPVALLLKMSMKPLRKIGRTHFHVNGLALVLTQRQKPTQKWLICECFWKLYTNHSSKWWCRLTKAKSKLISKKCKRWTETRVRTVLAAATEMSVWSKLDILGKLFFTGRGN